jgi:hypothetical protein
MLDESNEIFDLNQYGPLLVFAQVVYLGIITAGTSVRCYKYKRAGLNRLDAPKPWPYKVKIFLQIFAMMINLALATFSLYDKLTDK